MTARKVSIVIVSRGRPDDLHLCLTAIAQLTFPPFEVVVVADASSRSGLGVFAERVKLVRFERPNISAARNAGIAAAAGELIAFIDDDAVPEPTWLTYLTAPFDDQEVAAAGGYVLGRNGISFQWKARMVFADGQSADLPLQDERPAVFEGTAGRGVKTEGTNMAVRRDVLVALGGFDPAYAFYLDETDLNMRLASAGKKTAIVPRAIVHHAFAASARRTAARIPRDLSEIGASIAVFQRKHGATPAPLENRSRQRVRLLGLMRDGLLLPGEVTRLLRGFDAGWQDGLVRDYGQPVQFGVAEGFIPFRSDDGPKEHRVLSGRFWQRKAVTQAARKAAQDGDIVSAYLFSFSALYHAVAYQPGGFWLQTGGQFGKSLRADPIFRPWTTRRRLAREKERVGDIRLPKKPPIA